MTREPSQKEFLLSYFKQNPNRDIPHAEVVDWATKAWRKQRKTELRDPDRAIRSLAQEGYLIKVQKGVYRYEPDFKLRTDLEDFGSALKEEILRRDGYRCVICGKGTAEGVELHVDHIKPKDAGGKATLSNGQTLCAQHNFQKKNHNQTETGKRLFIRLRDAATEIDDQQTVAFCEAILEVYEKHGINGHIEWKKEESERGE